MTLKHQGVRVSGGLYYRFLAAVIVKFQDNIPCGAICSFAGQYPMDSIHLQSVHGNVEYEVARPKYSLEGLSQIPGSLKYVYYCIAPYFHLQVVDAK